MFIPKDSKSISRLQINERRKKKVRKKERKRNSEIEKKVRKRGIKK
jgi:hypothetical protein